MKLKKSLLLALAIVIIGINLTGFAAVEAAVINVPGDYGTITEAIDAANPGDTIMVGPGVYYENLYIDKIIRIGSTSGVANTIIDGNVDGNVVLINNTRAIFSGFTVRNSGKLVDDSGVRVINADDSTITHNVIEWTRNGIHVEESDNDVDGNHPL